MSERLSDLPIHPARVIDYYTLMEGLERARKLGFVYRRPSADGKLQIYVYTPRCVYEDGWDEFTVLARGLVVDVEAGRVVATPFPKFFNAGERNGAIPDLPFEAFEKLDGSLAIVFHHEGRWIAATKGAFESEQALWATARLESADLAALVPGTTYLFEAIYPENRIVVRYDEAALVLLSGYDVAGRELSYEDVLSVSASLGWRAARRYSFGSVSEMMREAAVLPRDEEGFVVRFSDGLRLKIKGSEYRRIHALISRCTPLAMWEAMAAGDDMDAIRRDLPEEFWKDYDDIVALLQARIDAIVRRIEAEAAAVAHLGDKELGLEIGAVPEDVRGLIFAYRKTGRITGRSRENVLKSVRPTGNVLDGYVPSYSMGRLLEEAAS